MESNKNIPTYNFDTANKLADLFAQYVDQPQQAQYSNPTYANDPGFTDFSKQLSAILGVPIAKGGVVNPQQFGETQNPPQYRGIRLLLPMTGGTYSSLTQDRIPNYEGLQQMFLGEMIRRGYPVLGGTGQMPGFEPGFNPVGFGQREDIPGPGNWIPSPPEKPSIWEQLLNLPGPIGFSDRLLR